jgi:hypothetical protein
VQHESRREVRAVEQTDRLIQAWQLGRQRQFNHLPHGMLDGWLVPTPGWRARGSERLFDTGRGSQRSRLHRRVGRLRSQHFIQGALQQAQK